MPNRFIRMTIIINRNPSNIDDYLVSFRTSLGDRGDDLPSQFSPKDRAKLDLSLHELRVRSPVRYDVQKQMAEIGSTLFNRFIWEIDDIRSAYLKADAASRSNKRASPKRYPGRDFCLELEIRDPDLSKYPWELLCHSHGYGADDYLVVALGHSVIRRIGARDKREIPDTAPLVNVLVAMSCPFWATLPVEDHAGGYETDRNDPSKVLRVRTQPSPLNFLDCVRSLERVQAYTGREVFTYTLLEHVTVEDLQNAIHGGNYNILYYLGHSYFDVDKQKSYLLFEKGGNSGEAYELDSNKLRSLLMDSSIRLAVLSSCNSARHDPKQFLTGATQALTLLESIEAVVGMQLDVPIHTAQAFDVAFLTELAALTPFDQAVARGRKAMCDTLDQNEVQSLEVADWAIPVLLARTDRLYQDTATIDSGRYYVGFSEEDLATIGRMSDLPAEVVAAMKNFPLRNFDVAAGFDIGCFPVTHHLYKAFLDDEAGHQIPTGWTRNRRGLAVLPEGKAMHPVVNVTFDDALSYCRWRGMDLPLADEWEIAARGPGLADDLEIAARGPRFLYPWGNEFEQNRCNVSRWGYGTTSVFKYPGGRSGFGIWDAIGNVYEWAVSSRGEPVVMGGCWDRHPAECLPGLRPTLDRQSRHDCVGFRCVRRRTSTAS